MLDLTCHKWSVKKCEGDKVGARAFHCACIVNVFRRIRTIHVQYTKIQGDSQVYSTRTGGQNTTEQCIRKCSVRVYSSVFLKEYTWFVYSREYTRIHLEYTEYIGYIFTPFWVVKHSDPVPARVKPSVWCSTRGGV